MCFPGRSVHPSSVVARRSSPVAHPSCQCNGLTFPTPCSSNLFPPPLPDVLAYVQYNKPRILTAPLIHSPTSIRDGSTSAMFLSFSIPAVKSSSPIDTIQTQQASLGLHPHIRAPRRLRPRKLNNRTAIHALEHGRPLPHRRRWGSTARTRTRIRERTV